MDSEKLPSFNISLRETTILKEQLLALQKELEEIEIKLSVFENQLRNALSEEIIEEQELYVLYKQLKHAKKQKRLDQKKKGKNYKEPTRLRKVEKSSAHKLFPKEEKEKKRLYREAMLNVHPDKFSLQEHHLDNAHEITTKLIEIYNTGDLSELQSFHAHIMSGSAIEISDININSKLINKDSYLVEEIEKTKKQIAKAKSKHTYKVLIEYDTPLSFIEELKAYYKDRIFKLKKRTRKA